MNLTKLALALAAIAALTAFVGVSSASALQYKSSSSPVNLSGNQTNTHKFNVDGSNVSCTSATFSRNGLATPANEVSKYVASYNNCTAFGFAASVNMGTCTYNLDTPNASLEANADLACTSNANVTGNATNNGDARILTNVFGSECEVHVESQNNKGTITIINNFPGPGQVTTIIHTNNLTAEKSKDNGLCPLSGTGTVNNATYNGDTAVSGQAGVNYEVS